MACLSIKQAMCQTAAVVQPRTLAAVVGVNLQRIRREHGLTQHQVAYLAGLLGHDLSRSRVAAMEGGKRQLEVVDLVLLAIIFNVGVAEFLTGSSLVRLSSTSEIGLPLLREIVQGRHIRRDLARLAPPDRGRELLEIATEVSRVQEALHPGAIDADVDLARRLNVPVRAVTDAAYALWDRPLTEERNARTPETADDATESRNVKRGHITRKLQVQLIAELDRRGVQHEKLRLGRKNSAQ
jgi:transcriptional regulator with XRE-family HTH domain